MLTLVLHLLLLSLAPGGKANPDDSPGEGFLSSRLDGIDVEAVLKNNRILRRYLDCMLDKGPCTAEGREFKKRIPEAMQTDCAKCNEVQRRQARTVLDFLIKNEPSAWQQLATKYDPDHSFRRRHDMPV